MGISQKVPFAVSISNFTQRKIDDNQQSLGQVLPCTVTEVNGAIVTVNFEVLTNVNGKELTFPPVTCPIAESTYVRLPVQVGDKGIVVAANTRLGGISGLGLGLAPLTNPSNLGGLVFMPIGNKDWESVDPNAVNINAPNGAVIRDSGNNCVITLTPTETTVTIGTTRMTIDATGVTIDGNLTVHGLITGTAGFNIAGGTGATMNITGDINQTGSISNTGGVATGADVTAGSISLKTHKHGGVQTGGGQTSVPV